ncbi:MAG: TonB-dependent receptor plug domain-containing protein, partial [Deltaproteobacteria bacterium]|nr:TonB-dependent receptor plug domain-containing protein [Deltaproteobacteria bacterium]
LLERESYERYEEVVIGKRARVEVSRTSLRGREIHRVPGTFGDPFKVTNTLPGVSQLMSLVPLPVIRGVGPSQSGFLLDGIALPIFYHSLAGPSVIHPAFIERVDFSPGNPAVEHGGYTGGIINGVTKMPFQDADSSYSIDLNLIQGGGFIRESFESMNTEVMAAARVGYPNGVLSLLNSQTRLSYWDYQTRISWGDRKLFLSAMFLGAHDKLETLDSKYENGELVEFREPTLWAEFHKIIFKLRHQSSALIGNYHVALSYDLSALESADPSATSFGIAPHLDWQWNVLHSLKIIAGLEAEFRELSLSDDTMNSTTSDNPTQEFLTQASSGLHKDAGSWLALTYEPLDAWFITPGVRVDVYSNTQQSHWGIQPRLQISGKVFEQDDQSLWFKAASGIYQQPPRPYFTLPGLSVTALELGLLKSYQNMIGTKWDINAEWSLDLQVYYNHLDPTLFELNLSENQEEQTNQNSSNSAANPDGQEWLTGLSSDSTGRAYGLEVILRKDDNGHFFGWLSYALARSERRRDESYVAYDFDRTHILNLVAGFKFSGNWEIGSRLVFQTGTPLSTDNGGVASGRSQPNWRIDLRIDKRIVFNQWLLDFYVEILNVGVTRESGGLLSGNGFRYVLPTLGLKANL